MSKERARRRAERERLAAERAERHAAEQARRKKRAERRARWRRRFSSTGTHQGILARRARVRSSLLISLLAFVTLVVWVVRTDWAARLGVIVVAVLAYPVLRAVLFPRP